MVGATPQEHNWRTSRLVTRVTRGARGEQNLFARRRRRPTAGLRREGIRCPRGDLNPHALIRALAPQASASANSATRTSAQGTLATEGPVPHIGNGPRRPPTRGPSSVRMGSMATDREHPSYAPSYDPAGEVV